MEQKILSSIEGINIYGIISICIFFGFFSGMLLWAFALKKTYLTKMSDLPLEGGETNSTNKNQS
ncbi:MAG: hypothetical protein WCS94_07865 [Verrucomicrobiota bacterium]